MKRKHDGAAVSSRLIRRPIQRWSPLFLLPMVAAFCIGFVYPFLRGVYLSFCSFRTTSDATFVGLANYARAFKDSSFVHSFWYTALFAVVSLTFINVLAFGIALLKRLKMTSIIPETNAFCPSRVESRLEFSR